MIRTFQWLVIGVGLLAALADGQIQAAMIVVDFSPDTTHLGVDTPDWSNAYGTQIIGDRFTLSSDVTLTGGSIFSDTGFGSVGDAARFLIFADITGTPSPAPIVNISTTIDAIDTMFTTSQAALNRKHVTISPTFLAAGTYWFSMPGGVNIEITQATSADPSYDDDVFRFGLTQLDNKFTESGDMFFQLEAGSLQVSSVPEPDSLLLFGLGMIGAGIVLARRGRAKHQGSKS